MAWVARNNGLTGSALNVNHIIIHSGTKNLASENHELFIATDDGIWHTSDGGRTWAKLNLPEPSNDEFSDTPPATLDELNFYWIGFNPLNLSVLLALAVKDTNARMWVYTTTNFSDQSAWSSRGVIAT